MTSIGETLRRERLKRNFDLDRVSRELKISPKLLDAIENERFEKLPGGVFAKSFVRQYAHLLGLDEEEIVAELQRVLEPQASNQHSQSHPVVKRLEQIPLPRVERWDAVGDRRVPWSSSLPALALVLVMMLACSAIYSWWQWSRRPVAVAPPAPLEAVNQLPAVTHPAATAPANAPSIPAPAPVAANAGANTGAVAAAADASREQVASTAPPSAAPTAASAVPAASSTDAAVRVEMTAVEPVWVSARSDGKYVFSGTLATNQSQAVTGTNNVVLRLGNAGGLRILLNGKPIGPVGPKGQIRTIQLTSGGFQIVVPEASKSGQDPVLSDD
ncbi:MAG TPA: RodZ domain-containing protein, partial [Acetobacteraceae bacterium]|nr:RodZ domain-containing protein [Acetobacteraceae bacterium]